MTGMTRGHRAQIAVVTALLAWLILARQPGTPLSAILPAILAAALAYLLTEPRQSDGA